jgi:exosortase
MPRLLPVMEAHNLLEVGYAMLEMSATAVRPNLVPPTSSKIDAGAIGVVLLFFGLLWLEVINHLKAEWSLNPQYGYGWSVPFLALYLIWKRWAGRPPPASPGSRAIPTTLIVFCALLFFPIRLVAEANPDWRLLSWAFALMAVSISILWMFLAGGWPWLRHFAFPILFFLVAVPWPMHFEQVVVQNLMRAVTTINVALMNIVGIPAVQHGNVIEVSSGLIGIEEACSGVRSLQAGLMISLFLGELYSFTIARRSFLLIAGASLAFLCNVVRTALLVWMGAKHGAKSIEAWHDPAGLTILLVCLFGLWLLSLAMRRQSGAEVGQVSNLPPDESAVADLPTIQQRNVGSCAILWPLFASLALWLVLAEAGVQLWYRIHQSPLAISRWAVQWPGPESGSRPVPIAPEAESLLRFNEGGAASWQATDGHRWMMYFFRWFPGRTAALFVKIHRPDICLPASGLTMDGDSGLRLITVNGVNLPVRSYRFDDHGAPLHVFYCYWDARSSYENATAAAEEDWTARGRLRAAWRGRREIGAQMLELAVWGYEDDAMARAALEAQLTQVIQRPG